MPVRVNTAKQKLLRGECAFGYGAWLGSAATAEILGQCGIDFVLIDTQHGSWGHDSVLSAMVPLTYCSAMPMVRVAANNYTLIGRLLDEGMMGIVAPMIDTAADAKAFAQACRYPPIGERSWGYGRARFYGDDYTDWIDEQLFVAVQMESVAAVENAEAIMATPGIDGCWIGPSDLALSMGFHPREMGKREEHAMALERIRQACLNTGKVPGIACTSPEMALQRAKEGFRFITAGNDAAFLRAGALAGLKVLSQAPAQG